MGRQFVTGGKSVALYGTAQRGAPVVYLNTVRGEGASVWRACQDIGCPDFTLVAVSGLAWDHDMSPWAIPPISNRDTPCTCGADAYLELLTDSIMPKVEAELPAAPMYSALVGYSLAGLFAVFAAYRTGAFRRIGSASGSFWFPGFVEFATGRAFLKSPECLYLSLGDREKNTRNATLSTVEAQTRKLAEHYSVIGIQTVFTLNPGNHFTQPNDRMARAIQWILETK